MINPQFTATIVCLDAAFKALGAAAQQTAVSFDALAKAAPQVCCTQCGSTRLQFSEFDHGEDLHTGYHDVGEMAECLDCGAKCDKYDLTPVISK